MSKYNDPEYWAERQRTSPKFKLPEEESTGLWQLLGFPALFAAIMFVALLITLIQG